MCVCVCVSIYLSIDRSIYLSCLIVVEPYIMMGLQPTGPTRVNLEVIVPSSKGLTPAMWGIQFPTGHSNDPVLL